MHHKTVFLLALLLPVMATAQTLRKTSSAERIIRQNHTAFSADLVAGRYQAVAAAYTPDARLLPPNLSVVTGWNGIEQFWTPPPGSYRTLEHRMLPQEIVIQGKTAFDWGEYEGRTLQKDGSETSWSGKYILIWKETSPGVWKIYLDIWNRNPPTIPPYAASSEATVFAGGVVSGSAPEFGGAFSRNGDAFWFNRTNDDRSRIWLMETRWNGQNWSTPMLASFSDTLYRDLDPWVSPADGALYFSSNRPLPNSSSEDYNLWRLDPATGKASPLESSVNTEANEIYASFSKNGNVYFARFAGGKSRIYRAEWDGSQYGPAQQVAIPLPDSAGVSNPAISADEQELVFSSGNLGGIGSADLFVSRKTLTGEWTLPYNLGPVVNSPFTDFAPSFSPDGKTLIFTSERPGMIGEYPEGKRRPGDIYAVEWLPQKADEAAIRSIHRQYVDAWLKGDETAVLGLFTTDARITPNGKRGIDSLSNIRAFWFPKDGSSTVIHQFDSEILSLEIKGDMAYTAHKTRLYWSYKKDADHFAKIQYGIAHSVLRRQNSGGWKIWRQSWTDLEAQEAPAPE